MMHLNIQTWEQAECSAVLLFDYIYRWLLFSCIDSFFLFFSSLPPTSRTIIFVTSNLKPDLSPSTNKSRTLRSRGREWGTFVRWREPVPVLCSQSRVSAGASVSSAAQPGKAPPHKFSRSLGLAMRSEPEEWVQGKPFSSAQLLEAASPAWQREQ